MADPTPTPGRLWRTMLAAFSNRWLDVEPTSTDNAAGLAYAAEIRALRDWIEQWQIENYSVVLPDVREVLDWLAAEALRAERGDK